MTSAELEPAATRAAGWHAVEDLKLGLEAGRVGVWSWDTASNELYWSPNLEAIHRLPDGGFDGSFSFFENDIHPDDRQRVMQTIQSALKAGGDYYVQYRLPANGAQEERWLEARGRVVQENGVVVGMSGICQDITERKENEVELRRRVHQQEEIARLGQLAMGDIVEQKLLDAVCETITESLDVEFCKILELTPGGDDLLLRAGTGWKPGLVGTARVGYEAGSQAGFTLRSGEPVVVADLSGEDRFSSPTLLHDHGVTSGLRVIMAGDDGRAYGVLGAHTPLKREFTQPDIDFMLAMANIVANAMQRFRARERQMLLIRELRHRVGNLLSLIISLFNNSAAGSETVEEVEEKFLARVISLSRAHSLISEGGWKSASLDGLVRAVLEPYLDRIEIEGRDVSVGADGAFALSMALHELATNASKYGALSVSKGRLDLGWTVGREDDQTMLRLTWVESGGPATNAPTRRGFGSKLITAVVERQLDGAIEIDFAETGLRATLTLPIARE